MSDFERTVELALSLTPLENVRLVERVMATLEHELEKPDRTLRGLWQDIHISDEEFDQARQEMWGNFPREDVP